MRTKLSMLHGLLLGALIVLPCQFDVAMAGTCKDSALAVQILGSGGPVSDSARASSGYLVWAYGRARVMVDAGGGTFQRFGASGARIEDLDLIALSHFHTDHAAELPALMKSGFFSERRRTLPISGPAGSALFPDTREYLHALFDAKQGAFRYLSGYLDGEGGLFKLDAIVIDHNAKTGTPVIDQDGLKVSARGVPHGIVPTLAYRIDTPAGSIAFGSDQNGGDAGFIDFVAGVDVLVLHMAIADDRDAVAARLHATPERLGEIAAKARPGKLVLSHLMARSLAALDDNIAKLRARYKGPIVTAEDLECVIVPEKPR